MDTIYVDGGMNRQTGNEAWACVVSRIGIDLIEKFAGILGDLKLKKVVLPVGLRMVAIAKFPDVASQQNNGAELIAMLIALRIAARESQVLEICSDSQLIVNYWSKGAVRKKLCPEKMSIIAEVTKLRASFEKRGGHITKISGDANPADLGYH